MKNRYSIKKGKNGLWQVHDNQSPIKVIDENGNAKQSTFKSSHYTKAEAIEMADRLTLRHVWGK